MEDGRVSAAPRRPGLPTLPAASPTREGRFPVFARSARRRSPQFRVRMPWWSQFCGGEGIHFSTDFAGYGYRTAAHPRGAHGCANVRDEAWLRARWARSPLGTPVVVVFRTGWLYRPHPSVTVGAHGPRAAPDEKVDRAPSTEPPAPSPQHRAPSTEKESRR